MKYAITGPQGAIHRVSATAPIDAVAFTEITDEQAELVAAGRASTPTVIYFLLDGVMKTGEEAQLTRRAVVKATMDAKRAEFEAAAEAKRAEGKPPAVYALDRAERLGIDVPFGDVVVRLACGDRDRAMFSSALVLYRTYEDELPSEEAKAAFRSSPVTFADSDGHPHTLTVSQARSLIIAYGSIYASLWSAAVNASSAV